MSINERQSKELADDIGKMLAIQLDTETVKTKVNRLITDYLKTNNINADPAKLAKNINWSVKVTIKQ